MTEKNTPSRSTRFFKALLFSLIPCFVLLAGVETTLRLVNFKFSLTPLEMRSIDNPSGVVPTVLNYNNRGGVIQFVKDAKQHWVPKNSPLKRHSLEKTPGVLRIAALGDSCTAGCTDTKLTYPGILEDILKKQGVRAEVLNAGVGSYSSYQGLQRLKYAVLPYKPDILTIYFGWNDHWITGTPDSQIKIKSDAEVALVNFMENFRTFQGLNFLHNRLLQRRQEKKPLKAYLRVSVQEYFSNLSEIVRIARENHIRPILITAPYEIGNWNSKGSHVFPFPKERLLQTHTAYLSLVKRTAAEMQVELFDLAEIVKAAPAGSVISKDGIHFHEAGCRFVASKLAEFLQKTTPELRPAA